MKTTINAAELRELNACTIGYDDFVNHHGETTVNLSQCLESNSADDVYWLLDKVQNQLSGEQISGLRSLACGFALINIEKIKPYCSDSDYQVVLGYLKNPAAESAARSAAESAAGSAAESAAESAAGSAVRSAAWSAARSAAESAAWSAAWSAESAESAAREYQLSQIKERL